MTTAGRWRLAAAPTALLLAASLVGAPGRADASVPPAASVAPTSARPVTQVTRDWRAAAPASLVIGRSVRGRPIVAHRQGNARAPYVVLVVGQMHGNEPAGRAVVAALLRLRAPGGVQLWTVSTLNPDGSAARTRRNARGVDLNRNFASRWRPTYTSVLYYPGRRAASEPETRATTAFLDRLRPDLVVSLHQAFRAIDTGNPKTRAWALRLSRAFGLPRKAVPCRGPCTGTMTGWYNALYDGDAVTVELPGRVPAALARAYARATVRVAAALVPPLPTAVAAPTPSVSPSPTPSPTPTPTATASATPTPTGSPTG